jgi:hypothetical protein
MMRIGLILGFVREAEVKGRPEVGSRRAESENDGARMENRLTLSGGDDHQRPVDHQLQRRSLLGESFASLQISCSTEEKKNGEMFNFFKEAFQSFHEMVDSLDADKLECFSLFHPSMKCSCNSGIDPRGAP